MRCRGLGFGFGKYCPNEGQIGVYMGTKRERRRQWKLLQYLGAFSSTNVMALGLLYDYW